MTEPSTEEETGITTLSSTPTLPIREFTGQPSDTLTYEFDPNADITLVLRNAPQNLPPSLQGLNRSDLAGSLPVFSTNSSIFRRGKTLRLRVSSRHLTLSCPYFARMLESQFREGTEFQSTGQAEIELQETRTMSFLLLMFIIHCRTRQVPTAVTLSVLTDIAVLVDYYECHDAIALFANLWIKDLAYTVPKPITAPIGVTAFQPDCNDSALNWLLISWVFKDKSVFKQVTSHLLHYSIDEISSDGLPIPGSIIERLNSQRNANISFLINDLNALHSQAAKGCQKQAVKSVQMCTYTVLGALTKHMMDMKLHPTSPASPYKGIGITELKQICAAWTSPEITEPYLPNHHAACSLKSRVAAVLKRHPDLVGLELDDTFGKSVRGRGKETVN
ncbi:uncharacterized protein DSM5745_10402 [Aspergillus mulundensis]|uniref:BTB domain-containing protein n=1 Tax=Aspergillus mulundensis TaxID=1810919 RepID=A0A3D8QJ82_9EURO|nr:hypothetical protein DSM5745_10402 [Aspergillus mulundensis]RDW61730.1 hypothetical protein DSM5745_10402 [Aspergillus mulundensis]